MSEQNIKLALSMIISETEPIEIVKRAIENISPHVDGMFVSVTYKEAEPEKSEIIDYLKSKNVHLTTFKWTGRFDEARNYSIAQVPQDYQYFIWMDADDVWHNPQQLRPLAMDAMLNNIAAVFFDYWYMVELDEQGNVRQVLVKHKRERIIRNDNTFKWIGKLHETLIEQRQYNVIKVFKPDCVVVHLTDPSRTNNNLSRNISILENAVKIEGRKDPRTLMYLAKAYFDRAKIHPTPEEQAEDLKLAEDLFMEYLDGSGKPGLDYQGGSGWAEERSSAYEYLSDIYRYRGHLNKAIKANLNSLLEGPQFPNYYLDMAMNYVLTKEFQKAETWLNLAKNIPYPDTTLIVTPRDLKARALEIDYHIGVALNQLERARDAAKKLVEIFPTNPDMHNRLAEAENKVILNKVAQSIVFVGRYLESTGQQNKMISLIHATPDILQGEQFMAQMRNRFLPARLWNKDEIAIVCGPGFEGWSPANIGKGIGGSEAAVIYQAKELAKLGYKVTVYADPRENMGNYDGVEYVPWYNINLKDTFNIVILWRAIGFVDSGFSARQIYLWAHDVPAVADYTEARLARVNKIFVLSEYHKSLFRMINAKGEVAEIPDDKFLITKNGTFAYDVDPSIKRDPFRMIYTSSYDRGLVHLLAMWPELKKQVPEASLRVYYGWQTYDAIFPDNPERKHWKAEVAKMMTQDGIKEMGRVSHEELAKAYQESGIFAYPCEFQEISCQNAMSAQIYGAVPVVTNYAALKETVQFGKKVNVDITSTEGKEEYIKELVASLKDHKWQEEERKKMMEASKTKFLWSDVALQWKDLFDKSTSSLVSLI